MSNYITTTADFTADLGNGLRVEITTREDASPVFVLLIGQHDFYLLPEWDAGMGQWRTEVNIADEEYDLLIYEDGTISRVA